MLFRFGHYGYSAAADSLSIEDTDSVISVEADTLVCFAVAHEPQRLGDGWGWAGCG
jgi:hypothetical protein